MRNDKRGGIDEKLPPILQFEADNWYYLTNHFQSKLKGLVGSVHKLKQACNTLGYQRTVCKQSCEQFFP